MTLLDFFGKVVAAGGFFTFCSFFLLMMFGTALMDAGKKNDGYKKNSDMTLLILIGILLSGFALIFFGALGYIWVR